MCRLRRARTGSETGVGMTFNVVRERSAKCGVRPDVAAIHCVPLRWAECRIGHHIYFQLSSPQELHQFWLLSPVLSGFTAIRGSTGGQRSRFGFQINFGVVQMCCSTFALHPGRHQGIACTRVALARRCTMNTLRQAVRDYLDLRRSLGFKLMEESTALPDFVAFMEQHRASYATQALALA
jgi:hypothetical protein